MISNTKRFIKEKVMEVSYKNESELGGVDTFFQTTSTTIYWTF